MSLTGNKPAGRSINTVAEMGRNGPGRSASVHLKKFNQPSIGGANKLLPASVKSPPNNTETYILSHTQFLCIRHLKSGSEHMMRKHVHYKIPVIQSCSLLFHKRFLNKLRIIADFPISSHFMLFRKQVYLREERQQITTQ